MPNNEKKWWEIEINKSFLGETSWSPTKESDLKRFAELIESRTRLQAIEDCREVVDKHKIEKPNDNRLEMTELGHTTNKIITNISTALSALKK